VVVVDVVVEVGREVLLEFRPRRVFRIAALVRDARHLSASGLGIKCSRPASCQTNKQKVGGTRTRLEAFLKQTKISLIGSSIPDSLLNQHLTTEVKSCRKVEGKI